MVFPKADKIVNTGRFKTLVSGDSIRAQRKHQQAFSFRNYAKLIFSTNKIPESEDRRIHTTADGL
jgi:phage/plasmid-associated DNA primase